VTRSGFALGLGLLAACNERGAANFERMIEQRKVLPYAASSAFADGMALRRPPEGTVPRSGVSVVPVAPVSTPERLARGQNRFAVFCAPCHGKHGDGRSKVAAQMLLRPPPSFYEPRLCELPLERVFATIGEGYGLMPSYAASLDAADRWAIALYVKELERDTGATGEPAVNGSERLP